MTTTLRESMTRFESEDYVIRVWREERLKGPIDRAGLTTAVHQICRSTSDLNLILTRILALERVNAVEGLIEGNGEVWYRDWP